MPPEMSMSDWKRAFDSPVPNWAMAGVSVYMLLSYISQIDFSDIDRRTASVALAWAVMLVLWLSSAIYKTWFRR